MIFDSHMHIGAHGAEFDVSLDAEGLVAPMRASGICAGALFAPDNEAVCDVVVYSLPWSIEELVVEFPQDLTARSPAGLRCRS